MTKLFPIMLILSLTGLLALHFYTRLRRLKASVAAIVPAALPAPNRYRPMARLLSTDDEALVAANKPLARQLKRQRVEIFRQYLSCLSADYGKLLAGLRFEMAESGVDRPELATALLKNQVYFTLALCRIEYRLFFHSYGFGLVDVSGLVEALTALRTRIEVSGPALAGAH